MDMGDFVIIINAEKVALTGQKLEQKKAYRHSGYPGGLTAITYAELLEKNPSALSRRPSAACSPRTHRPRAAHEAQGLPGAEHPHAAQQPKTYTLNQVAQ